MQIINAIGWDCPRPIIATKQALDLISKGQVATIVDNKIALDNLVDFARSLGYESEYTEADGIYTVITSKNEEHENHIESSDKLVIVIASDKVGEGAEELGKVLMKSFLFTQLEATPRAKTIIFMNSGVFLTCEGSPEEETLRELEALGIEILTCGACLNFYGLTESLIIGSVTNMYNIVQKINNASLVNRV